MGGTVISNLWLFPHIVEEEFTNTFDKITTMEKEISCDNNNKICWYCVNARDNSSCLKNNIAKCMMDNIEI